MQAMAKSTRKHMRSMQREEEEEEEFQEVDDDDKDLDYQPDKDPEQDFVVEDVELDDEDTFEIEKHIHAINLQEAGDYVVEICRFVTFWKSREESQSGHSMGILQAHTLHAGDGVENWFVQTDRACG